MLVIVTFALSHCSQRGEMWQTKQRVSCKGGKDFSYSEEKLFCSFSVSRMGTILSYWYLLPLFVLFTKEVGMTGRFPAKRGSWSSWENLNFLSLFSFSEQDILCIILNILILFVIMLTKERRVTDGTVCFLQRGKSRSFLRKRGKKLFFFWNLFSSLD